MIYMLGLAMLAVSLVLLMRDASNGETGWGSVWAGLLLVTGLSLTMGWVILGA